MLLDGRALAQQVAYELAPRIAAAQKQLGRTVGLGVILVGDSPASAIYVRNKQRAAARSGIMSRVVHLPATIDQATLQAAIATFNTSDDIDAFLLQLPIPPHLDAQAAVRCIDPKKDADGLHPSNVAALVLGEPALSPCTPAGCLRLIAAANTPLRGAHAVVVGRSSIVGRPMAQMLMAQDATVTVCHAHTKDLMAHTRMADVLVVAAGVPHLITADHVARGATIIDVGINRHIDTAGVATLLGDVDTNAVRSQVHAITPVPGGVGPMTIAMLLSNAVQAAEMAALSHRS
jgi:methylenetetrahydrofolate dehydrogenase (NADP+)/methenyltetrahydrofolate cyclohydrolase